MKRSRFDVILNVVSVLIVLGMSNSALALAIRHDALTIYDNQQGDSSSGFGLLSFSIVGEGYSVRGSVRERTNADRIILQILGFELAVSDNSIVAPIEFFSAPFGPFFEGKLGTVLLDSAEISSNLMPGCAVIGNFSGVTTGGDCDIVNNLQQVSNSDTWSSMVATVVFTIDGLSEQSIRDLNSGASILSAELPAGSYYRFSGRVSAHTIPEPSTKMLICAALAAAATFRAQRKRLTIRSG